MCRSASSVIYYRMKTITRKCKCGRVMVTEDPHDVCKNCRPLCGTSSECEMCSHLSLESRQEISKGYTKLAVRRLHQAKWLRNRRRVEKKKETDAQSRLRALESVLQLQSLQGTSLQTLLLAEGLPPMSARPSTSTAPDPPSSILDDWETIADLTAKFQSEVIPTEGITPSSEANRQSAEDGRQSTEISNPPYRQSTQDDSLQQVDGRQSSADDRRPAASKPHSSTEKDRQSTSTEERTDTRSTTVDSRHQSDGRRQDKQSTVDSHQSTTTVSKAKEIDSRHRDGDSRQREIDSRHRDDSRHREGSRQSKEDSRHRERDSRHRERDSRQPMDDSRQLMDDSRQSMDDSRRSYHRSRRDWSSERRERRRTRSKDRRNRSRSRHTRSRSRRRYSSREYSRRSRSPRSHHSSHRVSSEERLRSEESEREGAEEDSGFLNAIQIIERIYQLFPDLPFPPEVISSKPKSAGADIAGPSKPVAKKALPMAELITGLKDQLDKAFADHQGTAPVIRPQQWATNFKVFNLNFKDRAPIYDGDLGTIAARSTSSTVMVPDKILASWDTTARQALSILSCMDFYLAAMINRFSGSATKEDKETLSFLHQMGNGLSSLTQANSFLSTSLLQQRRQTCLDMTKLDSSLKITLMSQPWATSTLFNDSIAECLKSQQTLDSVSANQRLVRACNAYERMGHTQKRNNPSFPRHQQRKQRTDWKPAQSQTQIPKPTSKTEQKGGQKSYTKPRFTSTWKGRKQNR